MAQVTQVSKGTTYVFGTAAEKIECDFAEPQSRRRLREVPAAEVMSAKGCEVMPEELTASLARGVVYLIISGFGLLFAGAAIADLLV